MDQPPFDIIREVDNGDGTVDIELEITEEFIEYYKKITGKKRTTKKGIQDFVTKLIADFTNNAS